MAIGGYSIELKLDPGSDAAWFTKGTVERFSSRDFASVINLEYRVLYCSAYLQG